MQKILIVEDDPAIASIEKDYLEVNGYEVDIKEDGIGGCEAALSGGYDLILLDVMLPGMDGIELCKMVRDKVDIPIMMVSARREEIDKIKGLGVGADDFIEKPFSPGVLVAKVKAALAQYKRLKSESGAKMDKISVGDITLECDTHRVFVGDKEVVLPNKEFRLLEFLMNHVDIVYSREELYAEIWGLEAAGNTATVPVHINRLRDVLEENPSKPKHIITIWGVGYKFKK